MKRVVSEFYLVSKISCYEAIFRASDSPEDRLTLFLYLAELRSLLAIKRSGVSYI
jgi:hypothetical protein